MDKMWYLGILLVNSNITRLLLNKFHVHVILILGWPRLIILHATNFRGGGLCFFIRPSNSRFIQFESPIFVSATPLKPLHIKSLIEKKYAYKYNKQLLFIPYSFKEC